MSTTDAGRTAGGEPSSDASAATGDHGDEAGRVRGAGGTIGDAAGTPGAERRARARRRRASPAAIVTLVYIALAVAFFHALWFTDPRTVMQPGGDQGNYVWLLNWTPWSILHGHSPFYSDYLNYPWGVNLLTNAGVVALGALFSPITLLAGPVFTLNLVETLSMAGSAIAAYALAVRYVRWRPAAFTAGLLYGFSPFMRAEIGHLNLTFAALPPLILLVVDEIVARHRWRARTAGITLGLLCTAQFFISSEILFDTVIVAVIAVVTAAISLAVSDRGHLAARVRRTVEGGAWAAGVAILLLAYPVWFALAGPARISGKIQLVPQAYRADLLGPIVPDMYQLIAPSSLAKIADHFANSTAENGSYLGIVLMLVLAVTVVLGRRRRIVQVAAVTGVATFILSMGSGVVVKSPPPAQPSGLPLPGRVFVHLPLFSNAIPVRFALFTSLCAGIILAVAMEGLHDRWLRRGRSTPGPGSRRQGGRHAPRGRTATRWPATVGPVVLAAACLVLLIPAPMDGIGPTGVPTFFSSPALRRIPNGSVAVLYPFPSSSVPNGALWQAVTDFRFRQPGGTLLVPGGPNGDVAFNPAIGYGVYSLTAGVLIGMQQGHIPAETRALRSALRAQFASWHVRSFVAFPAGTPDPPAELAFFTWLFGRPPTVLPQLTYGWFDLHT